MSWTETINSLFNNHKKIDEITHRNRIACSLLLNTIDKLKNCYLINGDVLAIKKQRKRRGVNRH